jgi:cytochrome P450
VKAEGADRWIPLFSELPRRRTAFSTWDEAFLDPQVNGGGFDFVEDLTAKSPAMLIGALLASRRGIRINCGYGVDLLMRYEPSGVSEEKANAIAKLNSYMADPVSDRQRHPRDDMVSDLLSAEVLGFFTLLQSAGSETTARLLGWAAVLLARHSDERMKLIAKARTCPDIVARGELSVIRFGRRILVPKAALLELLGVAASGN